MDAEVFGGVGVLTLRDTAYKNIVKERADADTKNAAATSIPDSPTSAPLSAPHDLAQPLVLHSRA